MRARSSVHLVAALTAGIASLPSSGRADDPGLSCTEDAVLVLDASGSMIAAEREGVSRIDAARTAMRLILPDAARHRRLGLVTLGPGTGDQCSNVSLRVPVQEGAGNAIASEIDRLSTDGGTPLSLAVQSAANALDYRNKRGVMVIVSDGDETCGRDPCEVAAQLKESARDLTIHVIAFKSSNGAVRGASCLAQTTNGTLVSTSGTDELQTALRKTLACPMLSSTSDISDVPRVR